MGHPFFNVKNMTDSESRIQQDIFRWFWNTYCLHTAWRNYGHREIMFHVPNEGKNNGRLVSVGLVKGVSDLIFTWKGNHHYCEIKTPTGLLSSAQETFATHIIEIGFEYHIIRSLDEFKILINKFV